MRDRLIELLNECRAIEGCGLDLVEKQADHLLANGVIVPPCKVGGNVYTLSRGKVKEWKACFIGLNTMGEIKLHLADKDFVNMIEAWNYNIGKTVFITRAEAERALERSKE